MMINQPNISIGILSDEKIKFNLHNLYLFGGKEFTGELSAKIQENKIEFQNQLFDEILFSPQKSNYTFTLYDVVIGIGFHWERKENQKFEGALKIIIDGEKLVAVNILPVDRYLVSVISSEMSATSSIELLKAHAVTSRSWLLAQIEAKKEHFSTQTSHTFDTETEHIKWYDKDDHALFDVCADDHCQRYQGITKATTIAVEEAVKATIGEVITYGNKICDARFSKCCGGYAETFETCWEDAPHPYLTPIADTIANQEKSTIITEAEATKFILSENASDFCNTTDANILRQVLNNYDQETADFYRWRVEYSQKELSQLIRKKSNIDFGEIIDLQAAERGFSGRIVKLKIVGTKKILVVGKELEIRKWLSPSHLYSSAFIVERKDFQNDIPQKFTIKGAGWGHGVGLCQIGAAVMAEKGFSYQEILSHYFHHATIEKVYNETTL